MRLSCTNKTMATSDTGKLFEGKLKFYEVEYYVRDKDLSFNNRNLYNLIKKLTGLAYPDKEDKFEKRWDYFYLPLKRSGKNIILPLWILKYNRKFYVFIHNIGRISIGNGKSRVESIYARIINEALRLARIMKMENGKAVIKSIPYDFRTGRIKGRYLLKELLSKKDKEKISRDYKNNLERGIKCPEISLKEYLDVAGICYISVYKKAKDMSKEGMYRRWADGRHGRMLSIKNKNSKQEFMKWSTGPKHIGCHPFEIIFSWSQHGIHLYPLVEILN